MTTYIIETELPFFVHVLIFDRCLSPSVLSKFVFEAKFYVCEGIWQIFWGKCVLNVSVWRQTYKTDHIFDIISDIAHYDIISMYDPKCIIMVAIPTETRFDDVTNFVSFALKNLFWNVNRITFGQTTAANLSRFFFLVSLLCIFSSNNLKFLEYDNLNSVEKLTAFHAITSWIME